MDQALLDRWLREGSRSFYLSMRVLPAPMRPGIALGYLLARASDTLADEGIMDVRERLGLLDAFDRLIRVEPFMATGSSISHAGLAEALGEERLRAMLEVLASMEEEQARLVREVLGTIISGQRKDLEWLCGGASVAVMESEEALWDYTWRVAGCVGEFWTRLGKLTLGARFSDQQEEVLLQWGRRFGQGLQLVNILRDMPADLQRGRCYLPVHDPSNEGELRARHAEWKARCELLLQDGLRYAAAMKGWRLRVAVALPAQLGLETVALLGESFWQQPQRRMKVSRSRVRWLCFTSALGFSRLTTERPALGNPG